MKVIKYGEGYEPKRFTCAKCNSEFEYTHKDAEIAYNNVYRFNHNNQLVISTIEPSASIICPVCGVCHCLHVDFNDAFWSKVVGNRCDV